MRVRGAEDPLQFCNLLRVVQLYVRIPEMQLQPVMQLRIFRATLDFAQRIVLERIYAAKTSQTIGIKSDLLARPIVFLFHPLVFVFDRRPVGIAELIGDGQYDSAPDSSLVQQRNQISGRDRAEVWRQLRDLRTKEVLVVIRLRAQTIGNEQARRYGRNDSRKRHFPSSHTHIFLTALHPDDRTYAPFHLVRPFFL